jgi:hypothetical protein
MGIRFIFVYSKKRLYQLAVNLSPGSEALALRPYVRGLTRNLRNSQFRVHLCLELGSGVCLANFSSGCFREF